MADEPDRAAEIRQGVTRLARRLRAERSPRGRDATERSTAELSTGKISILADLARHSPATAGDLAAAANQQPQSLTRLLAELAAAGLLVRTRSEADRRQVLLEITDAGRAALHRDMARRDAWLSEALASLTETEQEVLRLAARLMDRLAETPGMLPLGSL
jgi:DNA-binding MarR family transcriptional regulator